jgi:hypothetical protein
MCALFIGISGKLGSGKDTAAEYFVSHLDCPAQICRFADRLKQMTALLTSTPVDIQYTREGKQVVPPGFADSLGTLQQKLGMAMREYIHRDVWVHAALSPYLSPDPSGSDTSGAAVAVIVPDVRFKNEAQFLKEHGGILIRIEGDPTGVRRSDSANADARDLNHISETDLDAYQGFDAVIYNNGSLKQLHERLDEVMAKFIPL